MNIAESAACAVNLAVRQKKWVDEIDIDQLQLALVERNIMIGFLNDFDMHSGSPLNPAVQYFTAKGFFCDYDTQADGEMDLRTARLWLENCRSIVNRSYSSIKSGSLVADANAMISTKAFNSLLSTMGFNANIRTQVSGKLTKGEAIAFLYNLVKGVVMDRKTPAC
jgi:hypothetical protein